MALFSLVGYVELNACRQLGEFRSHHLVRTLDDVLATGTGSHAAKQQHVLEIIKLRVMRQRVAEINADGIVNLQSSLIARVHGCLDDL